MIHHYGNIIFLFLLQQNNTPQIISTLRYFITGGGGNKINVFCTFTGIVSLGERNTNCGFIQLSGRLIWESYSALWIPCFSLKKASSVARHNKLPLTRILSHTHSTTHATYILCLLLPLPLQFYHDALPIWNSSLVLIQNLSALPPPPDFSSSTASALFLYSTINRHAALQNNLGKDMLTCSCPK